MFQFYITLILCVTLSKGEDRYSNDYSTLHVTLVNSKEYLQDLSQQFVYELEDYGLCNTKLKNYTHEIARTNFFGHDIVGSIYFTDGFMHTLQQVDIKDEYSADVDINTNSAYMRVNLIFSSLVLFYNYFADLTETKFKGTVTFPVDTLEVQLIIQKFYDNDTIAYNIVPVGNHYYSRPTLAVYMDFVPSNYYTEIINRDIGINVKDMYIEVKDQWKKILGKAIEKVPFPKLCFMC